MTLGTLSWVYKSSNYPMTPKDARPTLKLRPWKINNKPRGFPGAPVNQVFAVLFQTTQETAPPPTATKTQNIR